MLGEVQFSGEDNDIRWDNNNNMKCVMDSIAMQLGRSKKMLLWMRKRGRHIDKEVHLYPEMRGEVVAALEKEGAMGTWCC